ncbi:MULTISPECIES: hypothetical protein [Methylobacterium]|uniref:hypothetical protein n=1 Tax=Methylobacterium TaxID=407 RepID=UPI0012E76989|nr:MULTISPECIES: hypothetical protein [Methylobacterium]MCI9879493.1 hypothetical protein [Methylobacterium goesingense]
MNLGSETLTTDDLGAQARIRGELPAEGPATPAAAQIRQATIRDGLRTPRPVRRIREAESEAPSRGFTLGWAPSLLLNLVLLTAPFVLVIALPPVLACRERAEQFGFFAGETLSSCTARGVRARIGRLDDRIKRLVRGSGR